MMVKNMQVGDFIREWAKARLLVVIGWLAGFCGLELVQQGWRQIPEGHQSFDPALAEHFKTLKMRNGKHINLAVSYSVVARWNASNKRRGQAEWTYGSDRHYADKYTDVDRKTWGQHMDDLAALGLVLVSEMKGKPAYKAVGYQIHNAQLSLVHAPGYGHDAQKVARHAQGYGHDAHPITESSNKELSGNRKDLKPAPARADAAAEIQNPPDPRKSLDGDSNQSAKVESDAKADDVEESATPAAKPITPPVPRHPPIEWLADDCPESPPADLKDFFSFESGGLELFIATYGVDRIRGMIEHVRGLPNVDSPPAMVIHKLRLGASPTWAWPKRTVEDGHKYISGQYANFIRH